MNGVLESITFQLKSDTIQHGGRGESLGDWSHTERTERERA
ncbi:hypothetical protein BN2537_9147 [Streptomyces venezuelae]|nr:hypothetical protein BN2537_9147 [Streptomyces venezuelae]